MVPIDASFLEGASSLADAFAKLGFGVREERARHVRAVLQCLARAPDILRSEEDGRHDHHVLLVLRDGGVDGGQLFVQIRYSSVPFLCVNAQATCPYRTRGNATSQPAESRGSEES